MKVFLICIGIIINLCWLISCQPDRLDIALELAGENRAELEKVLAHYKNDKPKYKAARFLIENMPHWYGYENAALDSIQCVLAKIEREKRHNGTPEELARWKNAPFYSGKQYDVWTIKAEYLIRNIDLAFKVYQGKAWNHNLSFEDFCEYILPYRIADEPLSDWRETYYNYYNHLLDSLYPNGTDVVEACRILSEELGKRGYTYSTDFSTPHQAADFLFKHRVGTCREVCDVTLYVMRACGIPVATDIFVYSPEYQQNHTWTVVRDTTGLFIPFEFNDYHAERGTQADGRKRGKVYRSLYGYQKEPFAGVTKDKTVPALFRDRHQKDVTVNYFGENKVTLTIADESEKFVYLGVFSPQEWIPVDIARTKGKRAEFHHLEPEIIYQPLYSDGKEYRHASYPFLYKAGDSTHIFKPSDQKETVRLYRKMGLFRTFRICLYEPIIGSRIEGSLNKDFTNPILLHEFTDTLRSNYYEFTMPTDLPKIRYVRYVSPPGKWMELADIAFYEDTLKKAIPLKRLNELPARPPKEWYDAITDGKILTYFNSSDTSCYLAYDMVKPRKIQKIEFYPRTDDNFVWPGDEYELFYNDGTAGWKSLGRQVADERRYVEYEVPRNALLWLRDRTKGREEQVFFIRDGKQVFVTDLPRATVIGA